MKRPALVIGSAAALILLSLTQILMAALMGLAAALEHKHEFPGMPQASPALMYSLCALFLGLAVWGIVTAIGLTKLRRWARTSILIIGGLIAFFGFASMAGMLIAIFAAPFLLASTGDSRHGSLATVQILFGSFAFIYALVAAIGIFWLVSFNRKTVQALFAGGPEAEFEAEFAAETRSRRPLLISIYAVFSLVSAAGCLLMALIPLPAIVFGVVFTGWQKALFYLACAVINAAIGIGLWKLEERARRLALGFLAFGGIMTLIYLAKPELLLRNNEAVYRTMGIAEPATMPHMQMAIDAILFGFSLLFLAAIAWMLHYYRDRFVHPAPASTLTPPQ